MIQRYLKVAMSMDLDGTAAIREVYQLDGMELEWNVGMCGELILEQVTYGAPDLDGDRQRTVSEYLTQVFSPNEWVHMEWAARNVPNLEIVA